MLTLTVPGGEFWNEKTEEFIHAREQTLTLEHSLVSLSKWESKWNIPFLSRRDYTFAQTVDYIRCMTLTQNVDQSVYDRITASQVKEVNRYMNLPMTATTFSNRDPGPHGPSQVITAEIIYYWMITYGIPFDPCQKWHLNRLFTLIRVCSIKNNPGKKMSNRETLNNYAALNAARRKQFHTAG